MEIPFLPSLMLSLSHELLSQRHLFAEVPQAHCLEDFGMWWGVLVVPALDGTNGAQHRQVMDTPRQSNQILLFVPGSVSTFF